VKNRKNKNNKNQTRKKPINIPHTIRFFFSSTFAHLQQTTLLPPPIQLHGPSPLPFLISSPSGIFL
jgi:hypothetical protein